MVLKPTTDSLITMELWLPTENWNRKFMGVGNGGFGGTILGLALDMPQALRLGYATAGTDTGHQEQGGKWAIGHPEKLIDFAYRSTHEMTLKAKQVIKAFYGQKPKYSYFKGCSTGGREALMEAQRNPGDDDGIIAGSPADRHIHRWAAEVARSIQLSTHPEEDLTAEKAALMQQRVMNACDTLREGFLSNPHQCKVDFSKLLCAPDKDDGTWLTAPQMKTIEAYCGGVKNSNRELIFSGQALGNGIGPQRGMNEEPTGVFDIVRIAYNDPKLEWQKFDLDRDMPIIDKAIGYIEAVNPDLKKFKTHGGKLLLTHGRADTGVTPETTIWCYDSVLDKMGKDQSNWMRLFMVPGMGHCGKGPGPITSDSVGAMEKWTEKGISPDHLMGTGARGIIRPLRPYPQHAKYKGTGDLEESANWTCKMPDPEVKSN
jgi:feruloyl esterase